MVLENLPDDMDSAELRELGMDHAKNGKCLRAEIVKRGFGEMEFTTADALANAIKELDNRRFQGGADRLRVYEKRN